MDPRHQRRVAEEESRFRSANDRLVEAMEQFHDTAPELVRVMCECGMSECMDMVDMRLAEYREVRAQPSWFIVLPGHVIGVNTERPVHQYEDHWVIEKLGAGRERATELHQ